MKKLFGTDGIRGEAGQYPLDPTTVTALGIALGDDLHAQNLADRPVLIGMDTRESGAELAARLADGMARRGVAVDFAGVLTTPGVAYLTRTGNYAAGVMISASHNPFHDNGIKIFARTGYKLPDVEERAVEEEIFRILPDTVAAPVPVALRETIGARPYLDFLLGTLKTRLAGMKLIVDCGNGAASALAPQLFRDAGADVTAICCEPDGKNINLNCGSTHLDALRKMVVESGADAGVAFDGDADRCMLIAPSGRVVDGDATLLITARRLQAEGHLHEDMVVSTVMSNLGLEKALERIGITMLRTAVGDKYVLEEMIRRGAAIGGEQSGHIIFREYSTTGDGMLTALKVLEASAQSHRSLDELAADLTVYPQILKNVRVRERRPLEELPGVMSEIRASEAELNGSGRVLVRYSGTEPLLRVMVEAPEQAQVEQLTERIAAAIVAEMG